MVWLFRVVLIVFCYWKDEGKEKVKEHVIEVGNHQAGSIISARQPG